jgi:hypothetical protein
MRWKNLGNFNDIFVKSTYFPYPPPCRIIITNRRNLSNMADGYHSICKTMIPILSLNIFPELLVVTNKSRRWLQW